MAAEFVIHSLQDLERKKVNVNSDGIDRNSGPLGRGACL